MVRTPGFHYHGQRLIPDQGTKNPANCAVWSKNKNKKTHKNHTLSFSESMF